MNLPQHIKILHQKLDELPTQTAKSLRSQLWDATEHLNEGLINEAEEIRLEVEKKLEYILANVKPTNY